MGLPVVQGMALHPCVQAALSGLSRLVRRRNCKEYRGRGEGESGCAFDQIPYIHV